MERWRPITRGGGKFIGRYEVSDHGRVKSVERSAQVGGGGTRRVRERILKQNPNGKPGREYLYVGLHVPGHPPMRCAVHVLVLEEFVGLCPPGMESCHGDGDTQNNWLTNLRWDTPTNNNADKIKHGRHRGRKPGGPICDKGHLRECVGVNDLGEALWFCRECKRERDNEARRDRVPTDQQRQRTLDYQREYQREYYHRVVKPRRAKR